MDLDWIVRLWYENVEFSFFQTLLAASILLIMDLIIFLAVWYLHKEVIIEYGYNNKKKKLIKKKISEYNFLQKITLIKLAIEAPNRGPMLYINMFCHILNIVAFGHCFVGYVCCYIFDSGWPWCLLLLSEICGVFVTTSIEFVPHLIWLPSEKKRYSK